MELDYRVENCLRYGYSKKETESGFRCECCGRAIYEGEDYYDFMDDIICSDCEYDYVLEKFHKYL